MPSDGGCTFAAPPDHHAQEATILWRADCDAAVLPVSASRAARSDPTAFDLSRIVYPVHIFRDDAGIEHVLIGDPGHHLRFDVIEGSVLDGPVRLHYQLADGCALPARILTLRRLLALEHLGRFPRLLFPPEPRAIRYMRALQAFDGKRAGATNREIVAALYGDRLVQADWQNGPNYLRSRLQRALRFAAVLVQGGYRQMLR